MTDKIHAPWTPGQVAALNEFQRRGGMHPFTCGGKRHEMHINLVAREDGWHCPGTYRTTCGYRQDWAHAFMADPATWPSNQPNWPCSCGGSWPISHLHADEHTLLDARTTPDNSATSSDGADNPLREQLITAVTAEVQSTAGPFGLIPRTVDAALATLEAHLDIGEAEAWCKACRRVWDGKQHRCESDAEQRLGRVRDALASFDGRGVIAIGHVNLDIPTAGEVIDAVRAALDAPQEQP